ncbi:MAG: regulatory protein RecX [Bacteroidota bacterium]
MSLLRKAPHSEAKLYDVKEAYLRASSYCAYQERSQDEVKERLREWNIRGEDAEMVIARLIEENFVNEERFAQAFAGGKFRILHWGRLKIRQELRARGLSENCIKLGMKGIEEEEYRQALYQLLEKKKTSLKDEDPLMKKQKLLRYAIGKGYENDLIWNAVEQLVC